MSAPWRTVPLKPTSPLAIRLRGDDAAALRIYQPNHPVAIVLAEAGRAAWRAGLRPAADAPPFDVDALAAAFGLGTDGVAAFPSSADGRWVVGFARHGDLQAVAKVGRTDDVALVREGEWLAAGGFPAPLRTAPVVHAGPWAGWHAVVMGAIPASAEPVRDLDGAAAACRSLGARGVVHGDLAPWNLLRHGDELWVLDWEEAREVDRPLHDLCHFVVRVGSGLHRFSPREAVAILASPEREGAALLRDLGLDPADAPERVLGYLRRTAFDDRIRRERVYRRQMVAALTGR